MNLESSRIAIVACLFGTITLIAGACAGSSNEATSTTAATTSTTTRSTTTTTAAPSTTTRPPSTTSGHGSLDMANGSIVIQPAIMATGKSIDQTLRTPDGRNRTYHLYVPSKLAAGTGGTKVPLLIALHGGTGWGTQFERNSGFDGLAEANRFLVVYPDGVGIGPRGTDKRTWNGGDCCGPAARQKVDDVAFIRLLIARLRSQYAIDPARVVASGHSNGGILAFRLACELSDEIVAIGVQSSALEINPCRPAHPVSVLQIHGSGDQNIPIGGGAGPKAVSGVAFNRPLVGAQTLAAADACPSPPTHTTDMRNPDLLISSWSPCRNGTQVAFIEVKGAPHAWMGHATAASNRVGVPYTKLDSSLTIWNFLSQHGRQ